MFNNEIKYAPWFAKDKKNGLQTHLTTNIPKWQVNTQTKTPANRSPNPAPTSANQQGTQIKRFVTKEQTNL